MAALGLVELQGTGESFEHFVGNAAQAHIVGEGGPAGTCLSMSSSFPHFLVS